MKFTEGDLVRSALTEKTWRLKAISEASKLCLLCSPDEREHLITQHGSLYLFYQKLGGDADDLMKLAGRSC